jgi:hypothetical protein
VLTIQGVFSQIYKQRKEAALKISKVVSECLEGVRRKRYIKIIANRIWMKIR